MFPLPVKPTVLVLVDSEYNAVRVASNIAPLNEMEVVVTTNPHEFAEEALGKTFNEAVE